MSLINSNKFVGNFISTGANIIIPLRSGVSTMNVYNATKMAADQTAAVAVQYCWQDGMPQGAGISYYKSNAGAAANLVKYSTANNLFTLVDTSNSNAGAINATITAISSAAIPVVTNSGVNGLLPGTIVRLYNVAGGYQLGGLDFTVGYNTLSSTTFSLDYMSAIAAATTGSWAVIPYDAMFYPRMRYITKITQAQKAVVTLSVTHGYKVGQVVRMNVPADFGMVQMNGIQATIVAVDTTATSGNTITINVNSSSFTPFAFPLTATDSFTPATTVPMAENTAVALALGEDTTTDATVNGAQIGMVLLGGATGPGGESGDQIFWQSEVAFSNEGQSTLTSNSYN